MVSKVVCPSCGASYEVGTEKLNGRRVKCKKCGHTFMLGEVPVSSADEHHVASGPRWYVEINGKLSGPFEGEKVVGLFGSGEINRNSLVWCEGMDNWQPLESVPEFASALARATLSDAQERGESSGTGQGSVERGPLVSPKHFGHAFVEAFDGEKGRIPPRLKDYISDDERIMMAFSLSPMSFLVSVLSWSILPALYALLAFLVFLAGIGGVVFLRHAVAAAATVLVLAVVEYMAWKNSGFVLTDRRLLGRRGVFKVRWVFLTRALISSVEVSTGLFDRLFGMERVTIRALSGVVQCGGISADISRKLLMLLTREPANEAR